jgi:hypothetical protein
MFIEPMLTLATTEPLSNLPGSIASQGRSWLGEAIGLWPVLLVALGLAIVLATAWKWWLSRADHSASRANDSSASADSLRQTAHQVAEDLDAKADRLAMLIKHADRRIKALSELTEGIASDGSPSVVTRTGRRVEPASAPAALSDPIAEQVYQMADSGLTSLQIAQKLSQPTGNVELMLALRR